MTRRRGLMATWVRAATAAATALGASLTIASSPAVACTCSPPGPACQAYWNTDAVFDATVTRIERFSVQHVVTLNVTKTWKGPGSGRVQVVTNENGPACGFEFKEGVRYLVFARWARSGALEVSLCSATREFDGTGDAAEFLASLEKPDLEGRVFGTIKYSALAVQGNRAPAASFPGVTVTLTGQGRTLTADALDGKYEFSAVPAGSYNLSATAQDGYATRGRGRSDVIVIPDPRACAEYDFLVSPATGISGRIVNEFGRGVRGVHLEIVAANTVLPLEHDSPVSAYTDESGYFDIRALPPGQYLVGLNLIDLPSQHRPYALTLYPGPALPHQVIDLTLGHVMELGRWEIPPTVPVVSIAGTIVWNDGTPAAGVLVNLSDVTNNRRARGAGMATSTADGRFTIDGREGRTYRLMAGIGSGPALPIGNVRIDARQDIEPIRIVIQRDPRQ